MSLHMSTSAKIVVTGTGLSGTGYMRRVFEQLGYRSGHEDVYSAWGYLGWKDYEVESSSYAPAFPSFRSHTYVHVVRDPLMCLRAHMSNHASDEHAGFWFVDWENNPTHPAAPHAKWYSEHLPSYVYIPNDVMGRAIRFIHHWTFFIESKYEDYPRYFRTALEGVTPDFLKEICGRDDLDYEGALLGVSKKTNSKPRMFDHITWDDVLAHPDGHLLREVQDYYEGLRC